MASAAFKVIGSTSGTTTTQVGHELDAGENVSFQLIDSPALDAQSVSYSVVAASKDAPALLAPTVAASPTAVVGPFVVPAGTNSWRVECRVQTAGGPVVQERVLAVLSADGRRKVVPGEGAGWEPEGEVYEQNEMVEGGLGGGATGASLEGANAILTPGVGGYIELRFPHRVRRWYAISGTTTSTLGATLHSFPIEESKSYIFEASLIGEFTVGSDANDAIVHIRRMSVSRNAGASARALNSVSAVASDESEQVDSNVNLTVASNNLNVVVIGNAGAAHTINWSGILQVDIWDQVV